ncbi:MAG: hypothetical protein L0216_18440 [Planctomycetales bacterium]|nr:hypothetical protein [Planctomycetales bacterium]
MNARRLALASALGVGLASAGILLAQESPPVDDGLVVHEWGTFTSMQGSAGGTLEGLHHEEEGLPSFVYSRREVRECPLRDRGYKGLEVPVWRVTRKMETPVTYFYATKPTRARVRVAFERGLLTQWFPVSDLLGPPEASRDGGPLDMASVERSFLEWEVDVLPRGEGVSEIPQVAADDPWRFARLPDSNCVRTVARKAPRMGPVETEKFLFYRGLGSFPLPIRATTEHNGKVTLRNEGDEPIRSVFLFNVRGNLASVVRLGEIPAGGEKSGMAGVG